MPEWSNGGICKVFARGFESHWCLNFHCYNQNTHIRYISTTFSFLSRTHLMYNRFQSPLRIYINAQLYHKPVLDIDLFWKKYQGIIREKNVGGLRACRIQILWIEWLTDTQRQSIRQELQPIYKKHRPFCIQLWIVDILSSAPSSLVTDASYTHTCTQLRIWHNTYMRSLGFTPSHKENLPPATYILDTTALPADLLAACSSHHRTKIKKAQKSGVWIRCAATTDDYDAFYKLLLKTGSSKWFGVISHERYTSLTTWIQAQGTGRLYIAEYNGNIIWGALYLIDHESHEAMYLYGATDRSAGNIWASQLTHREAILDLQSQGIENIDFFGWGPTGNPKHHLTSVGQLKEWFWTRKIEYAGSYDIVYNRAIYTRWKLMR